jgi:transposase
MNIPAKADPQLQFEFYTQELKPRLLQAAKGERKVFFVDAAHFVLGAFLGLVWCFARPLVRTSPGRQRYSVLGAIESHSKELISVRTRGNVNSETVCELLEKICEAHPHEEITLVMDNARYQHNNMIKGVAEAVGIELLFLPAYSPNLNLIERLWKLTKKRCLTNRYYEDFDKFVEGIDRCLDSFATTLRDEVSSLLTLNFQFFGNRNS